MIISATEIAQRLQQHDLVLLDVRLPEDFAAGHIPGAVNQCVFEVVFLPALERKGFSHDAPICVYGAGEDSHESRVAAEKLERAGFSQVLDFRGGLEAWMAEARPVERQGPSSTEPQIPDGVRPLNLSESNVTW